ncbi:MAG: hypothetical protein AAFV93_15330 [Chloroflexota bacterium]
MRKSFYNGDQSADDEMTLCMPWRFSFKLLMIVLPFAIVISILFDIALKLGDANPPRWVVSQQQAHPDLIYKPPWTRADQFHYKFTATHHLRPDVLLIGSSRVYHWRPDLMFDTSTTGYNASIPSAEPLEVLQFLEGLAERNSLPDVLILPVDELFYNDTGTFVRSNRVEQVIPRMRYGYDYAFGGFRAIARDYLSQPSQVYDFYQSYTSDRWLGYTAQTYQQGYRVDGSFYFSNLHNLQVDLTRHHQSLIANNEGIFQYGNAVFSPSLDATEAILTLADENDVTVVGLFLPYHASNYEQMMSSGNYEYIPIVREEIRQLFAEHNVPLFDYSLPEIVGGEDDEMYDYLHGGEVLGLRTYHQLVLDAYEILSPYSDVTRLATLIDSATDNFYLPD